jgi:uncharacterized protein YecE (DUF72 family)
MSGSLRVGCPMWVNRDWVGPYFPVDTPRGRELAAYSQWCTAVEGNTSFYALPPNDSIRRWDEQAPGDFRFLFKLPKTVTHDRRLRDVHILVADFVGRFEPLHDRMGPVSIQLPESFSPNDLDVLDRFLDGVTPDLSWSVEVRHRAFDADTDGAARLHDVLSGHRVDRILFHTAPIFAASPTSDEEREAHQRKPRVKLRPVAIASYPVVRLIVPDDGTLDPTDVIEPWRKWFPHVARWIADGRHPTLFAHTPDNRRSPALARLVYEEISDLAGGLAPLPDTSAAPGQSALF